MSFAIKPTKRFARDLKRAQRQGRNLGLLKEVVRNIADGRPLARSCRDHQLKGKLSDCRECHVQPDWLLIYRRDDEALILYLMRTGSHADLFDL